MLEQPEKLLLYQLEMPGEWTSIETSLVLTRRHHSQRRRIKSGKPQPEATITRLLLDKTQICHVLALPLLLMPMITRCNSCLHHKDTLVLLTQVSSTLMTTS